MADPSAFRWPVSVSRPIHAPAGRVWDVISSPGNLNQCHPFVEDNSVDEWPGVGSRDTVHYYSGLTMGRRFTDWIDGLGYDLEIGTRGGQTSRVSWRIRPLSDEQSSLIISIEPYLFQRVPLVFRWFLYRIYTRPMLTRYLDCVLQGFEFYIRTGQAVSRNQFGSHRVFSPSSR